MPVAPWIVRRAVVAPLVLGAELLLLAASPALVLAAAVLSPLLGGRRPLRITVIAIAWAAHHVAATLACLGLWVRAGFGLRLGSERSQRDHYALMGWFVDGIERAAGRAARVDVQVLESPEADEVLSARRRPLVVLSRHAGEGDSLLILHELLCRHGRRPRVVMHEALRVDPLIDVLGSRLPNRFVDPRGGDTEVEIAAMSRDLRDSDAVLIFPEGGNFSQARRERGIRRLEEAGHEEQAAWARGMRHVTAPRPGGALAALDACPRADAVFVAHVGMPAGLGEVWRRLPERQTIQLRLWVAPAEEIPAERDARIDWLFGWWRAVDAWVGERAHGTSVTGER